LLAELGLPPHACLLGCIGRLTVDKRVKDVIWAADLLKVIRDDVHLLIVGDGPHRSRLETFRDQVRIGDNVHFLGVRADVPRLLEHCDVLLAAGQTDVQSSSILEAMASGVPVVASDTPGHRELVEHDVTGDLAPVGDRGALTRQTMRLLDEVAIAGRLSAAARERVLSEFSTAQLAARHAEIYGRVLKNR
jgi:glycosyltransferase involved in cell wall biosynthesis